MTAVNWLWLFWVGKKWITDAPRHKHPHSVINPRNIAQVQNDMCEDKHWTILALSMDLHMRRHCACHHTGSWITQGVIRVAPKPIQDIRHKKHHTSNHWSICRSIVINMWTCDTLWWVTRHGVTIQLVSTGNQAHTQCSRHPTAPQWRAVSHKHLPEKWYCLCNQWHTPASGLQIT
jgi:hypothetical protein